MTITLRSGRGLLTAIALPSLAVGSAITWREQRAEFVVVPLEQRKLPPPVSSLGPPDFDLGKTTVPPDEIHKGGPPKDGIPALTNPATMNAEDALYLDPAEHVVGVRIGGEERAYPLRILTWHEVVNDSVGGVPLAVTYCPLCDSVAGFDRRFPGGVREFGVSGLLYNSNVLMYDRGGHPQALWSQLKGESVSGPNAGSKLDAIPVELTTWSSWKSRYPRTTVLSLKTGYGRDYARDPYSHYFEQPGLLFPVRPVNRSRKAKERVLGAWMPDGSARAYPSIEFQLFKQPIEVEDKIGGNVVKLRYDPESGSLAVTSAPAGLRWVYSFWFAWYAFHPETTVYSSQRPKESGSGRKLLPSHTHVLPEEAP